MFQFSNYRLRIINIINARTLLVIQILVLEYNYLNFCYFHIFQVIKMFQCFYLYLDSK